MKTLSPFCSRRLVPLAALALVLLAGCSSAPRHGEGAGAAPGSVYASLPRSYENALVQMQTGNYEAAIPALQAFIEDEPELAGPWLNLGIAYRKTGQADKALEAFRKASELNPHSGIALQQSGIIYREQGDFPAALAAYQEALARDPGYALAHRNIGILYDLYLRQPDKALEHYRKYLELAAPPDPAVKGWVVDLERRTGSSQARAAQ